MVFYIVIVERSGASLSRKLPESMTCTATIVIKGACEAQGATGASLSAFTGERQ